MKKYTALDVAKKLGVTEEFLDALPPEQFKKLVGDILEDEIFVKDEEKGNDDDKIMTAEEFKNLPITELPSDEE